MDHTRDNPLKRFTAFWIAILLVFCFGVALILLRPLTHLDSESIAEIISEERLEVKRNTDLDQEEALNAEALEAALQDKLKSFDQNTVEKGAMPVPSATPADADQAGEDQADGGEGDEADPDADADPDAAPANEDSAAETE